MKAADILLRDRNLPLVALDLKLNPPAQLRKISATAWHRLQRLAQQGGSVLVALTPMAVAAGVDARGDAGKPVHAGGPGAGTGGAGAAFEI